MADTNNVSPKTTTIATSSNLTDKEGYACTVAGALLEAATSVPFVIWEGANGSSTATNIAIAYSGTAYFKTGGVVTAGDKMTPTTGGVWITTTTDKNNFGGIALETSASGDVIKGIVTQGMISAT